VWDAMICWVEGGGSVQKMGNHSVGVNQIGLARTNHRIVKMPKKEIDFAPGDGETLSHAEVPLWKVVDLERSSEFFWGTEPGVFSKRPEKDSIAREKRQNHPFGQHVNHGQGVLLANRGVRFCTD